MDKKVNTTTALDNRFNKTTALLYRSLIQSIPGYSITHSTTYIIGHYFLLLLYVLFAVPPALHRIVK